MMNDDIAWSDNNNNNNDDMRKLGLKRETAAQARAVWRSAIVRKQSDPRKRGKTDFKRN